MIIFFSDVHLGVGSRELDKQREQQLIEFLEAQRDSITHVYILGDLFDYWFEYNNVIQYQHFRLLECLWRFSNDGVPIDYIIGNHDFAHRTFFEQELGTTLHWEDIVVEHQGVSLYLSHGDGKAHNDTGYRILKSILRNKIAQWLYKWVHPDIGIPLASGTSDKSRYHTSSKDYKEANERNGLLEFAEAVIDKHNADYVVMGHLHRPVVHTYKNGTYINLGDWIHSFTFATLNNGKLQLQQWDTGSKTYSPYVEKNM